MATLSQLCISIGLLFLVHAGYSAHEFQTLLIARPSTSSSSALPVDIQVETVMSVLLVCVGLVAGAERLRPISWSSWAGKIEREGGGANPFMGLEERAGFLDIRAKRAEFAKWVREDGIVSKK